MQFQTANGISRLVSIAVWLPPKERIPAHASQGFFALAGVGSSVFGEESLAGFIVNHMFVCDLCSDICAGVSFRKTYNLSP